MSIDALTEKDLMAQEALREAFERFNDASTMLKSRYDALKEETISLREQLRQKDLEVKRAEKLAMLGETAAGIAHEIRNPLGAIKLFISLLREDMEESADSIRIIDQMDRSVATLDHVVSNILQFSKAKKLDFAPVNMASLINEQVSHFVSDSYKIDFSLQIEGQPFISGNEHSLRQVMYNLILNACQAIRYNGSIEIKSFDKGDDFFVVCIKDSGSGVPEELTATLFEPFVTSKNEGTGLGLSIVKQILDEHGANIVVNNDGGAVFTIVFST